MNIGKNILNNRKSLGISQEKLAELINVSRQTISNWELEESYPDVNQLVKLAKVFDISINELVDNEETCNESKNGITIISKIENVIATCTKVQSSQEFKTGNNSPKYALFAVNENTNIFSNNTFLGWYENKESILREIIEIEKSIKSKKETYELKYNVEVEKRFFGMSVKIKR